MTQTQIIDLDLVDKTITLIPAQAWSCVRQVIVTALVDNMPGSVIERITGTYDDFDQAEQCLFAFYELPEKRYELIVDAFKIMGAVNVLELLDSAQLERFIDNGVSECNSSAVPPVQGERAQDD